MANFTGTTKADTITGTTGENNNISGAPGTWNSSNGKWTFTPSGNDIGDDTLIGADKDDYILGYGGGDFIDGRGGNDILDGGDGDDTINGGDGNDTIYGGGGNDRISTGNGDDIVHGGAGSDIISSYFGSDTIYGGDENDYIYLNHVATPKLIDGGADRNKDTIYFSDFTGSPASVTFDLRNIAIRNVEEFAFNSAVDTTIRITAAQSTQLDSIASTNAFANNEVLEIYMGTQTSLDLSRLNFSSWGRNNQTINIFGDGDPENITGSPERDIIDSGRGKDVVDGKAGNDRILTQAGNDTAYGRTGADYIHGGNGNDTLYGGIGNDELRGGKKNDTIDGGDDDDVIYGNKGKDNLIGGWGNDTISGGPGNDTLTGNSGNDTLTGGSGKDKMTGDRGDDRLDPGAGQDTMWGGGGTDTFIYAKKYNTDRIKDFQDNTDKLDLTSWGFTSATQALNHAVETNGHVKFDFTGITGAGANDILWVENITKSALADDILV